MPSPRQPAPRTPAEVLALAEALKREKPGRTAAQVRRVLQVTAGAESFFASVKGELIDTRAWPTRAAACRAVVECIAWYNGTRLHSTLGYRSPADFENDHHGQIRNAA